MDPIAPAAPLLSSSQVRCADKQQQRQPFPPPARPDEEPSTWREASRALIPIQTRKTQQGSEICFLAR
ncbi:hypothetical protein J5N97_004064 [Dioscorea zingiberensis]|uniref:Uncharacterized protein n=1 Tax=Dioscorea zingiberensis TaxID=325984 RepID=A0A9D5D5Y0_9LILI|nr:hypothetical protein J5N97_004064 [Dioscorea zingiberensis]